MKATAELKMQPVSVLKPAAYNPRKKLKPGDKEYEKIKNSVEEFGFADPLVVNADMTIIGGHQRLTVAMALGYTEVPCAVVDIDKTREKALNIALNKITGVWDDSLLADLLKDIENSNFDLGKTGFEPPEIETLFNKVHDKDIKEDDFDVESELKQPTFSQAGDLWMLGRHRVLCCDSTKAECYDKSFTAFQDVELSFTENLIPTHIPVKQYDNQARKVRCRLYQNSVEYKVGKDIIISYSATRPDGAVFQYSSETRPDLVFVDDGAVILTVTSFMTEVYGRFPIDIYLLSDEGDVIGSFSLVLNVARAAVKNGKIATLTYKHALDAAAKGILEFLITDDGYLVMRSDDKLGLAQGSVSSTIDKVAKDIEEEMVTSSINMDGHLVFQSWDALGLIFEMDDEGHLIVRYNEA